MPECAVDYEYGDEAQQRVEANLRKIRPLLKMPPVLTGNDRARYQCIFLPIAYLSIPVPHGSPWAQQHSKGQPRRLHCICGAKSTW